jgi:NAD(P)-dependent dehydrogenase (short-subunit alcohol dehydrogenase family)
MVRLPFNSILPSDTSQGFTFIEPVHHDTYAEIDPATKSNLKGKSVFISGASKGVGRATALSYAKAGASQIAIAARSPLSSLESEIANAAKAAGKPAPQVLSIKLDVQNLESVKSAAEETEKAFGRIDILINNAGYLETARPVADSDPDEYWTTWEINYRGVYWVTRAFLPLLLEAEGGLKTIVNLSSAGAHNLRPGMSGYQTSKFAILKFSEFLCAEYAGQGLLAYSVHPGGVPTALALNMPKETHASEFSCSGG